MLAGAHETHQPGASSARRGWLPRGFETLWAVWSRPGQRESRLSVTFWFVSFFLFPSRHIPYLAACLSRARRLRALMVS
jgi:hypothetical protein